MDHFEYLAYDQHGKKEKGSLEAESEAHALDRLAIQGLTPVKLVAGSHGNEPWWSREFSLTGGPPQAKKGDLAKFFGDLAAMLNARFPLPKAMTFCGRQTQKASFRKSIEIMSDAVANGETLGHSMHALGKVFPSRFISLVELGETSNQLDAACSKASEMLTTENQIAREIRSALIYPAILGVMSFIVLSILVFYLTPTLLPVFASAETDAPAMLRFLDMLRRSLIDFWPFLFVLSFLTGTSVWLLRKQSETLLLPVILRTPLIGSYIRKRETLRVLQALEMTLGSGGQLLLAISTAQSSTSFAPYQDLLRETYLHVEGGGRVSEAFEQSSIVDPLGLTMVQAGEESDQLLPMLVIANQTLAAETKTQLAQATRLLTPVITLVIGLGVGFVIISTISAILDLNDLAL